MKSLLPSLPLTLSSRLRLKLHFPVFILSLVMMLLLKALQGPETRRRSGSSFWSDSSEAQQPSNIRTHCNLVLEGPNWAPWCHNFTNKFWAEINKNIKLKKKKVLNIGAYLPLWNRSSEGPERHFFRRGCSFSTEMVQTNGVLRFTTRRLYWLTTEQTEAHARRVLLHDSPASPQKY